MRPIGANGSVGSPSAPHPRHAPSTFREVLSERLNFSRHATARMQERKIVLTAPEMVQLTEATQAAGRSGAKQAAIVMDQAIFIVSPSKHTVITSFERNHEPMQVVSQVDSVVIVGRTSSEAPSSRPTDGGTQRTNGWQWTLATE